MLKEELHKASVEYASDHVEYWQSEKDGDFNVIESDAAKLMEAFKAGAKWRQNNLWKSADGDYLPEIGREVVVFTQKEGLSPKVCIAHRPDPKGWDGTSISTGKTEHFDPMLYGKGGWSIPDVIYWLDAPLPFKEGGE